MTRAEILAAIEGERAHQIEKWGGRIHDSEHSPNDWIAFICRYTGKAQQAVENEDREDLHHRLIQVAALAVAAIEANQ